MKRKLILAAIRAARFNSPKRTSAAAYAQLEETKKLLRRGAASPARQLSVD